MISTAILLSAMIAASFVTGAIQSQRRIVNNIAVARSKAENGEVTLSSDDFNIKRTKETAFVFKVPIGHVSKKV